MNTVHHKISQKYFLFQKKKSNQIKLNLIKFSKNKNFNYKIFENKILLKKIS